MSSLRACEPGFDHSHRYGDRHLEECPQSLMSALISIIPAWRCSDPSVGHLRQPEHDKAELANRVLPFSPDLMKAATEESHSSGCARDKTTHRQFSAEPTGGFSSR